MESKVVSKQGGIVGYYVEQMAYSKGRKPSRTTGKKSYRSTPCGEMLDVCIEEKWVIGEIEKQGTGL